MKGSELGRPVEILLVEDNPGDVELTKEGLSRGSVPTHVSVAEDGDIALQMLRREPGYEDTPRPDVVLLDLNLPRVHGHEVLATMRDDPTLVHIPVIVLTTSNAPRDIDESYRLHASCYLRKPLDFPAFIELATALDNFWFSSAELPGT